MPQKTKVKAVTVPMTERAFENKREFLQNIVINFQPDVCAPVQLITSHNEAIAEPQVILIRKAIEHIKKSSSQELDFVKIDIKSVRVVVPSDTPFADALGLKSHLGDGILMADDDCRPNIVHYGTTGYHRVTKSRCGSQRYMRLYMWWMSACSFATT